MKFISLSDIHLADSLDFESSFSKLIRDVKWESFRDILLKNKDVDFALISGDLYERNYFTMADYQKLFRIIEEFGKNVYYISGNHDYIDESNDIFFENKPKNLYTFDNQMIEFFEYKKVRIYGISYSDRIFDKRFNYNLNLNKDYYNILLAHGEIGNEDSNYLNLDYNKLKSIGFDYVGVGHIHKRHKFNKEIYYVGSIEPQSFKDRYDYGYNLYDERKIRQISSAKLSFKTLSVDLEDFENLDNLISFIRDRIENKYNFLKLEVDNYDKFEIKTGIVKKACSLVYLELMYKKTKDYYKKLSKQYENTLLDDFYKKAISLDQTDPVNKRSLEIGFDAILRSKDG